MSLDHLDTPLRLTWDLGGSQRLPDGQLNQLAAAIVTGGVFFLLLERPGADLPATGLLPLLAGGGCQVGVVVGPDQLPFTDDLPLARLLLDAAHWCSVEGLDRAGLRAALSAWRAAGYQPDLLLVPRPQNLLLLPELIAFAATEQVAALKLPNLPVAGRESRPQPVGPAEIAALRQRLQEQPLPDTPGLQLEIHDLFLWELLTPAADRSGYSGCQAGNSVGHLDAAGVLYPCSSWPLPLGSLLQQSLYDLWQGSERFAVRDKISQLPSGCEGCSISSACFGGCRGLGELQPNGAGGRDPMCYGKR